MDDVDETRASIDVHSFFEDVREHYRTAGRNLPETPLHFFLDFLREEPYI